MCQLGGTPQQWCGDLDHVPAVGTEGCEPLDVVRPALIVQHAVILDDHSLLRVRHVDAAEEASAAIEDVDVELGFGESRRYQNAAHVRLAR